MLQNEPLVVKIGVDTAENEPLFGWIQFVQYSLLVFNSSILSSVTLPHRFSCPVAAQLVVLLASLLASLVDSPRNCGNYSLSQDTAM